MSSLGLQYNPLEPDFAVGPKTQLPAAIGAGYGSAYLAGNLAESKRHTETYSGWKPILDRVAQGYLKDLPEDLNKSLFDQGFTPDGATLGRLSDWIGENGARYGLSVTEDMAPDAVAARREEVYARDREAYEEEQAILNLASPGNRLFGNIVGGVGAELMDPLNIATLPIGAAARTSLLATMAIEAAVNAAIEAADTPSRNAILRRLGQEEGSVWTNAMIGALFGAGFGGAVKGASMGVGKLMGSTGRSAILADTEGSNDPATAFTAALVRADAEDEARATGRARLDPNALSEHERRSHAVSEIGTQPDIPDRPLLLRPLEQENGQFEQVDPRTLLIEPEKFQFKSEAGAGGVTDKLKDDPEWNDFYAGIVFVFEYADGRQAIADGHQRVNLANRLMAKDPSLDIKLTARVFHERDYTIEEVRQISARKNIAEAADGMTVRMARDAAKVLRMDPTAVRALPAGSGIALANDLVRLSEDAWNMLINGTVPDRFARLVSAADTEIHLSLMKLLDRTRPANTAQAKAIIDQVLLRAKQPRISLVKAMRSMFCTSSGPRCLSA